MIKEIHIKGSNLPALEEVNDVYFQLRHYFGDKCNSGITVSFSLHAVVSDNSGDIL